MKKISLKTIHEGLSRNELRKIIGGYGNSNCYGTCWWKDGFPVCGTGEIASQCTCSGTFYCV